MEKQIYIVYKNHRGEVAKRSIYPQYIWYGKSDWHADEQWFVHALDLDKNEDREFALKDILAWDM